MLLSSPTLWNNPRSSVTLRYHRICLTSFKCRFVRLALNLANKLTKNAMSSLLQFAKYINTPIATKFEISGPKHIFPSSHGLNSSFFRSNDRTTIMELSGWAASIEKRLTNFQVYKVWCTKILHARCSTCRPRQKVVSPRSFISNSPLSWEAILDMTSIVPMMLRSSTYIYPQSLVMCQSV